MLQTIIYVLRHNRNQNMLRGPCVSFEVEHMSTLTYTPQITRQILISTTMKSYIE